RSSSISSPWPPGDNAVTPSPVISGDPAAAGALLDAWGLNDVGRGYRNLQALAAALGPDLALLKPHFDRFLPDAADPDLALNALERFFANRSARDLVPVLLREGGRQLGVVVQLFGTSQFLGDVLAADPDFLETAAAPLRVTPTREELVATLREMVGGP